MNLNDFKDRWQEIQQAEVIERAVEIAFATESTKNYLSRTKILNYGLTIGFFLFGVVLIASGAFKQHDHLVLIPLVTVGLFFAVIVVSGNWFFWSWKQFLFLKKLTNRYFTDGRLLQIYLSVFKWFPFLQIYLQETFVEKDGFLTIGGTVNNQKFKVAASGRDVRFFLNQQPVLCKKEFLHNWNVHLTVKMNNLDPLKLKTEEAFIKIITMQITQNLKIMLSNLYTVYGKEN